MTTKDTHSLKKAYDKLDIRDEISFPRFLMIHSDSLMAKKPWFVSGGMLGYRRATEAGRGLLISRRPRITYKGKQETINRIFINHFVEPIEGKKYVPIVTNLDMNPWHWEDTLVKPELPLELEDIAHRVIDPDIQELVEHIKMCGEEGIEEFYTPLEIERAKDLLKNS